MQYSLAGWMKKQAYPVATELERRRFVLAVLRFTRNTVLEPSIYERQLLEDFVAGTLTLDEMEWKITQYLGQL